MNNILIQSDPSIMMGKPTITGTRITVELILEKLGAGETIEEILREHPRLTREAVLAAIKFGAQPIFIKNNLVSQTIRKHQDKLGGSFSVITKKIVRIRSL